ncbi:MAG TPA: hypothetical protein VE172_13795 [Stackebrandtia sp.]|jgi:hypothetical protein|uniref:hypothetical protein n=1 Tax=Stackebrandtia sp. TaxID=2023065 RepID=UPI002D2AC616|nr:hypothetical protein [Stackebrandtia sp.]HZE39875.1 hypothetical protein [Stackebrandtia sp.]
MRTQEIRLELRRLHRGRGVHGADLRGRLGERLMALAAADDDTDAAELRRRLVARLKDCAAGLPAPERAVVVRALGVDGGEADLGERLRGIAVELGCSPRTVQRKVDAAERLLAERIRSRLSASPDDGWYVRRLTAHMLLDRPDVMAFEEREIVSTHDGLETVTLPFDLPENPGPQGPRLRVEVRFGGTLAAMNRSSPRRPEVTVELSKPLREGESHAVAVDITVDAGRLTRPHYILIPERRYDNVDLRVRFGAGRAPAWVRRVEAETVRTFDPPRMRGEALTPDRSGEVAVSFGNPRLQLGYGVQWGVEE